jgi:hypothetical protein
MSVLGAGAIVYGCRQDQPIVSALGLWFLAIPVTRLVSDLLHRAVDRIREAANETTNKEKESDGKRVPWIPLAIGLMERSIVASIVAWDISGGAGFISTWIAIKTAGGWQSWSKGTTHGRAKLFAGLLGSLVSMGFALAIGVIVRSVLRPKSP